MTDAKRIYSVNGSIPEDGLLTIGRILIQGGYTVRKGKQKLDGKSTKYIEFGIDSEVVE